MLLKRTYPSCYKSFVEWYISKSKYEDLYYSLGSPRPFDTTLRDGLQSVPRETNKYTLSNKKKLYEEIYLKYFPKNIEVGSIVSKNVLPILADSMDLFNYAENYKKEKIRDNLLKPNHYILIPNSKKLLTVMNNHYLNHFSFITSVSNSFQIKNTKKSTEESIKDLFDMVYILDDSKKIGYKIKLYISCINECPIEGKLDNNFVVEEILKYNKLNVDNICLSDTCGTLNVEDFEFIVDKCNSLGIPYSKLSLHLHVKRDRIMTVKNIIHKALNRKIVNFDVSALESGGCSVTMEKDKIAPNLSYELYYESLVDYIEDKSK